MTIKNTAQTYGCVAKWIHWLTVLFFLAAYCSVYYRHWFTEDKTAENWTALQLHLSIGISIAVLVILRIVWKLMNRKPNLEPGTKFEHFTAKSGHLVLYGIMIIMPLTGYFGTGANTEFFFLV
jgi:cytochrome b561